MEPHPYQHKRPRRPLNLAHRTKPPPDRVQPPNLMPLLVIGAALGAIMAVLAAPYLIGYLIQVVSGG